MVKPLIDFGPTGKSLRQQIWEADHQTRKFSAVRDDLRRARPYCLSNDFVQQAWDLSAPGANIAFLLHEILPTARLPFEAVFVEYDSGFLLDIAAKEGRDLRYDGGHTQRGWLLRRTSEVSFQASCFVTRGDGDRPDVELFDLHIASEGRAPAIRSPYPVLAAIEQEHDEPRTSTLLFQYAPANGPQDMPPTFRDSFRFGFNRLAAPIYIDRTKGMLPSEADHFRNARFDECWEAYLGYGTRFLVVVLAMLHSVPMRIHRIEPSAPGRPPGPIRDYMINNLVTIDLPKTAARPMKIMRKMIAEGRRLRRHEVSGHWRRVKQPDGSIGRIWIKEHERGNAHLGYVRQERIVKTHGPIPPEQLH